MDLWFYERELKKMGLFAAMVVVVVLGVDADAAVIPTLFARSKGGSTGYRDPPCSKEGDHEPIAEDFHHSQWDRLNSTEKTKTRKLPEAEREERGVVIISTWVLNCFIYMKVMELGLERERGL